MFAGIFNTEGKLLIKRRQPKEMTFVGDWDLPGGALDAAEMERAENERVLSIALAREVLEETGIVLILHQLHPMPTMYPTVVRGGADIAFLIIVDGEYNQKPTAKEWRFVETKEFMELCDGPKGNQVVSGRGKRMCRLGLKALTFSLNKKTSAFAKEELHKIYQER